MGLPDNYEETCRRWSSTDVQFRHWTALGNVLGERPHWRFDADRQSTSPHGLSWCFGVEGESRLVITLDGSKFYLHDHDADEDQPFENLENLISWLEIHESEHEGRSALLEELIDNLEQRQDE